MCARKCQLGGQITGYAFPLPSALCVTSRVLYVDIAFPTDLLFLQLCLQWVMALYIESQAQNDHSCASNKGYRLQPVSGQLKCPETSNPKHGVGKGSRMKKGQFGPRYRFKIFRFKVNQQARGLIIVSASLFLCSSFPSSLNTFTRLTFCLLPKYLHTVSFPHSSG